MKNLPLKTYDYKVLLQNFRQWLDILGYSPSTVYNLPNHIGELLHYMEHKNINSIEQLDDQIIKDHYQNLKRRTNNTKGGGLSGGSLNKHLQGLYKFSYYLRISGLITLPTLDIEWEKTQSKDIQVLTTEEIRKLYLATDQYPKSTRNGKPQSIFESLAMRDRAMLTIFYGCGLRRNEGLQLEVEDLNFDRRIVHVRKGKDHRQRLVPFNKANSEYLQQYMYEGRAHLIKDKRESAYFISERGRSLAPGSMAIRLKLLQHRSEDIGLRQKNIYLHLLRHSIATHLLEKGMPLETIGSFLGHRSLESTQIYTHLLKENA